jgi:uncharacterized caspase-like protein/peptidoglycan hydrolase-like protein with peptidoglycan-binding domain
MEVTVMRFTAVLVVLLALTAQALAEKRVALIIGNSDYVYAPTLPNPRNDASDMSAKLESLGFQVINGIDLDFQGMRSTIREFVNPLDGSDIALFFYAGHGLQVNGENYLAPIDARLENENDLDFETIPFAMVLSAMERSANTNLIFLDACRNNPLSRNLARSMGTRSAAIGRGLARIGTGVGTLISFATQPGNVALDGNGRNSPFTAALVQHLGNVGEGITGNMIRVRNAVLKATDGQQVPWENSSLTGEVVLVPDTAAKQAFDAAQSETKNAENLQAEITYWNSIKDTDDKAYFDAYLARYPNGQFADIALLKRSELEKGLRARSGQAPNARSEPVFDRSKLANLDPDKAGASLPEPVQRLDPEQIEQKLELKPEDYQRVQASLNAIGYDVGAEDGAFGPNSRSGLRKYQVRNRIEETGYLDEKTLQSLMKTIDNTPKNYDGEWLLELHRYNYTGSDPGQVNGRTLLGKATVRLRNGELFVVSSDVYTSDKSYFDSFKGRLSEDGNLSISMRINTLFQKQQERDVRVSGKLPTLVPYGSTISIRGSKLWQMKSKNENVWLRLDIRRVRS